MILILIDPDGITYLIPGNDDSRKSIELYCKLATDSILAGIESSLAKSGVKVDDIRGDEFIQEKEDGIVQTKRRRSKVYKEEEREVVTNEDESR